MSLMQVVILAVIQGLAELLPVSSSAHVIAAAKLMRGRGVTGDSPLDPSSPQFTLLLVMLHTGTMFAVIVYFWKAWKKAFFSSREQFWRALKLITFATVVTAVVGYGLKIAIEKIITHQHPGEGKAEIEQLFSHLELLSAALAAAGVLILISAFKSRRQAERDMLTNGDSLAIGAIQGLCLPFRGFSRSGATISVGMLCGVAKQRVEEFSFALAVVLTPPIIIREAMRLIKHKGETSGAPLNLHDFTPSLIGMGVSFFAGLVALKLLSRLLEHGKWWVFGIYCLVAAGVVFGMYRMGY
jgi:undecaprenyl-diphosphatase